MSRCCVLQFIVALALFGGRCWSQTLVVKRVTVIDATGRAPLALLVDAGLTPLAALEAATRNAAEFMGQLDRRGTIEVGKTADLVVLDKDPLADIHNTRSIQAVVLGGKLYPRAALDAMLAKAQTIASQQEDAAGK
jgi:adenine deaminase